MNFFFPSEKFHIFYKSSALGDFKDHFYLNMLFFFFTSIA